MTTWPISLSDARDAHRRIRPFLPPTPLRGYAPLDALVGHEIRVLVKHENHNPTNTFKARNGMAVLTSLSAEERSRRELLRIPDHPELRMYAGRLIQNLPRAVVACSVVPSKV